MARRKRAFTKCAETLQEAFDYIKEVKRLNKNDVQIEMYEFQLTPRESCWMIEVWQVR